MIDKIKSKWKILLNIYSKLIVKAGIDDWFEPLENVQDSHFLRAFNIVGFFISLNILWDFRNGFEFYLFEIIEIYMPEFFLSILIWPIILILIPIYFGYRSVFGYPYTNRFGGFIPSIFCLCCLVWVAISFYGTIIFLYGNVLNPIMDSLNNYLDIIQNKTHYIISFVLGVLSFFIKIILIFFFTIIFFSIGFIVTMSLGAPVLMPIFLLFLLIQKSYNYIFNR